MFKFEVLPINTFLLLYPWIRMLNNCLPSLLNHFGFLLTHLLIIINICLACVCWCDEFSVMMKSDKLECWQTLTLLSLHFLNFVFGSVTEGVNYELTGEFGMLLLWQQTLYLSLVYWSSVFVAVSVILMHLLLKIFYVVVWYLLSLLTVFDWWLMFLDSD